MSFSLYEDLPDLNAEIEQAHEALVDLNDHEDESTAFVPTFQVAQDSASQVSGDAALSNVDMSSFANSDDLTNFESIVSLPPDTLASLILSHQISSNDSQRSVSGGYTIVSSAPSGDTIPAPEASVSTWAISPHPAFLADSIQGLSTVCTDVVSYQRLFDDAASISSSGQESNPTAPMDGTMVPSSTTHDRATFEAIANQLLRDVSPTPGTGAWYSQFTDFDWDQLREVAKVVLASSGKVHKLLPIPPSAPELPNLYIPQGGVSTNEYTVAERMPNNFICPICNDVLVGALSLDCGCTVCTSCWESNGKSMSAIGQDTDYVAVERKQCQHCHGAVSSTFPCHALDVAITQIVANLNDTNDTNATNLKLAYASRLEVWRQEVLERNELIRQQRLLEEDEMLAQMIEEEEKVLWAAKPARTMPWMQSSKALRIIGQTALALVTATLTTLLAKYIKRR